MNIFGSIAATGGRSAGLLGAGALLLQGALPGSYVIQSADGSHVELFTMTGVTQLDLSGPTDIVFA